MRTPCKIDDPEVVAGKHTCRLGQHGNRLSFDITGFRLIDYSIDFSVLLFGATFGFTDLVAFRHVIRGTFVLSNDVGSFQRIGQVPNVDIMLVRGDSDPVEKLSSMFYQ